MTVKSEEQLRKELRYFTEKKRSFDQIVGIIYELTWILARVTMVYSITMLAMVGSRYTFAYEWTLVATTLIFAASVLWVCYGTDFYSIYKPILKDGSKGLELIYSKTKSAVEAWRNTK